jgi:pimeloyl-ACP methyl ester carboxylesterase
VTELTSVPPRLVRARADVAVWELGEGDPILLLHGFPDHPLGLSVLAGELADRGRRVLCPALPGYPPSAPVPGGDYRLAAVAADLVAVLDAAAVERVTVIGHDWGASLAYELGASHPDRVMSVIALSAPHPAGFSRRRSSYGALAGGAYALFLAYVRDAPRVASRPRWLTALAQMASPSLHRRDWPALLELFADEETMTEVCRYYRCDLEEPGEPRPVPVPATVIYGDADGAMPVALFEGLEEWFPAGLRSHELVGAGHWPHLERPAEAMAAIETGLVAA